MRNLYYILDGKKVVLANNILEWAKAFETGNRIVNLTEIGKVRVSTVFLGLNHNYFDEGKPILFETMIFGGEHDSFQNRYCTWEEAEKGHFEAVKMCLET